MYTLGKKIKNLRLEHNMTQEDLAFILGVSKATISNYEKNKVKPKPRNLVAMSNLFGIKISQMFVEDIKMDLDENLFNDGTDIVYGAIIGECNNIYVYVNDDVLPFDEYSKRYFRVLQNKKMYFTEVKSDFQSGDKVFGLVNRHSGVFDYKLETGQHVFSSEGIIILRSTNLKNVKVLSVVVS